MRWRAYNTVRRWKRSAAVCVVMLLATCMCAAQTVPAKTGAAPGGAGQGAMPSAVPDAASGAKPGAGQCVVLDRIVAVVNGDVILESDVDEERRFEEIQPYRRALADLSRETILERLVDRDLILQQSAEEPEGQVSDEELDKQLTMLRKDIPDCKPDLCVTDEGWAKFLGGHGFTIAEFRDRWRMRMELLKFIEVRFRSGITISDDEIKTFYETRMVPEYAKRKVAPPQLETISKRIQEILLQQQVRALLVDWLKSLRAQGSVKIMTPGEVAP